MGGDDSSDEMNSDELEEECDFDMEKGVCPGVSFDVCEKWLPDSKDSYDEDDSEDWGEWSEELCVDNAGYKKCRAWCEDCGICVLKGLDSCDCDEHCDGCAKFLPCLERDYFKGDDKDSDDESSHDD